MAALGRALYLKEPVVSRQLWKASFHTSPADPRGAEPAMRSPVQSWGCSCHFLQCLSGPLCVLCQLEQNSAAMETANTRQSGPCTWQPSRREIMAFVVIYWTLMLSPLYPQALTRDTLTLHHQCARKLPQPPMLPGDQRSRASSLS